MVNVVRVIVGLNGDTNARSIEAIDRDVNAELVPKSVEQGDIIGAGRQPCTNNLPVPFRSRRMVGLEPEQIAHLALRLHGKRATLRCNGVPVVLPSKRNRVRYGEVGG